MAEKKAMDPVTCTVLKKLRDNGRDYAAGETVEMERFRAEAHARAGIVRIDEEGETNVER